MKKFLLIFFLAVPSMIFAGERLSSMLNEEHLAAMWEKNPPQNRFPEAADRKAWEALKQKKLVRERVEIIRSAGEYLLQQSRKENLWPSLPLDAVLAFTRSGNREVYEKPYFARRNKLSILVLAECLEYKGRYIPLIMDGLWQIMSEPHWQVTAHAVYGQNDPMPLHQHQPDLFALETGMIFAETAALLGREIRAVSPQFLQWMRRECVERVIVPVESGSPWWLNHRGNWNPWCCTNTAVTALVFLKNDPVRLVKLLKKLASSCGRFYELYPDDGSCDEGSSYFSYSGLKLLNFLDLLDHAASGCFKTVFREEKMRCIGEYFVKVSITGNYMASYADCVPWCNGGSGYLYRFAELIQSREMMDHLLGMKQNVPETPEKYIAAYRSKELFDSLADLFFLPQEYQPKPVKRSAFQALPRLQFFVMRELPEDSAKGKILTIKGGHNGEGHNHNDVGEFSLFKNGRPVLIDLGAPAYTRFIFSSHRYENWIMNSFGHHLPVIDGALQGTGKQFHASVLEAKAGKVVLDLSPAWGQETKLRTYTRTAAMQGAVCSIADELTFCDGKEHSIVFPLYSAEKPVIGNGRIRLGDLELTVSGLKLEKIEKLVNGENVFLQHRLWPVFYRLVLQGNFREKADWKFTFK